MTTETCEACGGPLGDSKLIITRMVLVGALAALLGVGVYHLTHDAPDPIPGLYVPGDDEPQNPMAPVAPEPEPPMPLPTGPKRVVR